MHTNLMRSSGFQFNPNMSRMFITFPLLMMANKINWEDENTLQLFRLSFFLVLTCTMGLYYLLYLKVEQKNDRRKIFVPPAPVPGMMGPTPGKGPSKETTYLEHELGLCKAGGQQVFSSALITCGIHFYFKINPPLVSVQ